MRQEITERRGEEDGREYRERTGKDMQETGKGLKLYVYSYI